jgi:hypothetical protein
MATAMHQAEKATLILQPDVISVSPNDGEPHKIVSVRSNTKLKIGSGQPQHQLPLSAEACRGGFE